MKCFLQLSLHCVSGTGARVAWIVCKVAKLSTLSRIKYRDACTHILLANRENNRLAVVSMELAQLESKSGFNTGIPGASEILREPR